MAYPLGVVNLSSHLAGSAIRDLPGPTPLQSYAPPPRIGRDERRHAAPARRRRERRARVCGRRSDGVPFGPPVALTSRGELRSNPSLTSDDQGNATLVMEVEGPGGRRPTVVLTSTRGGPFGPPIAMPRFVTLAVGHVRIVVFTNHGRALYASTGTIGSPLGAPQRLTDRGTGAVAAIERGDDGRVHIAVADDAGSFATRELVSATADRHGLPLSPAMAVDRTGQVLVAYTYGFDNAVQGRLRRAGGARFGPLHVITKLGEGGRPSVAFVAGRPLIVYRGREDAVLATTNPAGPPPNLAPPHVSVTFSRDARGTLSRPMPSA